MTDNPSPDPREISGVISRVNQFGAATERLFSRLYTGLNRKSQQQDPGKHIQPRPDDPLVNEYKQRLAQQQQEIEQLAGMLSSLDEGIIMQDTEGRITFVNKAARDLLGNHKNIWETELGLLFNNYRDVTHLETELEPLGAPVQVQVNNRVVGAQLAAVANEAGDRLGTMIVLRDVTQDTLMDRLKDQFVTAISHELKTPMTVIKGMSEVLLSQDQNTAPNRRLLETLSRNVDILDRMVIELLDISEIGAGSFSVREDTLNMETMVWSIINGMAPEIKRGKLTVKIMTRDVKHLYVKGDDQRLRWALGHLIQNSTRYNQPGGRITVTIAPDEDNPDFIVVEVIDNGVGISEKDMPHIFERFYRGEPRTSSGKLLDPRGLGQGLFVARTVAEVHGGYVRAHSQQGQGSIFTLALPAAKLQ